MSGKVHAAALAGVGYYVPPRILTNSDLEKMVDTSDAWITERTGIKERRIASEQTTTADLSCRAERQAIEDAGIEVEAIELVIVSTVTPDMGFPATACLVADRLGLKQPAAFDLEAGCSGFVYALAVGDHFIRSGMVRSALIIGADILSRITDWNDRNTCVLFGDGAGAVVLSAASEPGIMATDLGSDGSGGELLKLPAGGSRKPADERTVREGLHTIKMDGRQVFRFAVKVMGASAQKTLKKAGLSREDIDLFIPHQANMRIIDAAARRLDLSEDRVFINLPRYGNTSNASIPIALAEAVEKGRIRDGNHIIAVGFGAGLTWASALFKWRASV